jgi:hypothetical protein
MTIHQERMEERRRLNAIRRWVKEKCRGDVHALSPQVLLWELTYLLDGLPLPTKEAPKE